MALPTFQAASLGPKSFHGRQSCLSSCSSAHAGVNSWGEHFPSLFYGCILIFPQHAQQTQTSAGEGSSHRELLLHFNVREGSRNLEEDCSHTKAPWTELPEPRDLFICITGWNFQFLIRITWALTRTFANLLLYISIHIYCISWLG